MKRLTQFLILGCMAMAACTPIVRTTRSNLLPLEKNQEVLVLGMTEVKPDNAVVLGQVTIDNSGTTTDCSYESVIEMAKAEARKNGGNILKIVDHKMTSSSNDTCHGIRALILRMDDLTKYKPVEEEIIQNADYAILKIYMPSRVGAIVKYDLYLGDSIICTVKNNSRAIVYVRKDGPVSLRASVDDSKEFPIDITYGRTYYLRCGMGKAGVARQPNFALVDSQTGEEEFESITAEIQ